MRTWIAAIAASVLAIGFTASAQTPAGQNVQITVDAAQGRRPISPFLFGKNNEVSTLSPQFVKDVGLRIARDSNGNNCTKYDWKDDLSSHPDWYNNVYPQQLHDRAKKLATQYGDLQVLYGLQVLGWVAKPGGEKYNFLKNDGHTGPGPIEPPPHSNLCANGKTDLYLQPWTPKDTVDFLDYLFKSPDGPKLDPARFHYWHLDNEPEGWNGTHHDIVTKPMPPEECIQKYVAVAKELRTRYPNVRIMAPGFMSEWFWWNWQNQQGVDGMPWAQYFIKRMGEESKKFGKPLVDVIDYHTYIDKPVPDADLLQQYRVFYDKTYQSPQANGCRRYPDGGWHEDQKVEYIFGHTEEWLDQYFGKGHGITIGITECGPGDHAPMVNALWYASMLGTYADHGVEVYCPWEWYDCWWEVMHVFSRYGKDTRVQATSSDDAMVSAYASQDSGTGAITIIFVNRDKTATKNATASLKGFSPKTGNAQTLTLANLPTGQTFKSHEANALKKGTTKVDGNSLSLALPPYSITAVLLEPAK